VAGRSAGCLADRYFAEADQVGYSLADGSAVRFPGALRSPAAPRSAEAYSAGCSAGHSAEHCRPRGPAGYYSAADPAGCPRRSGVVPAVPEAPS